MFRLGDSRFLGFEEIGFSRPADDDDARNESAILSAIAVCAWKGTNALSFFLRGAKVWSQLLSHNVPFESILDGY